MKKLLSIFALSLLLISCSNNTPEKRVNLFYEALSSSDSKKAQEYATEKTSDYIKEELGKKYQVTVISCETVGNEATCKCVFNDDVETKDIRLLKINDEWKVDKEASVLRQFINSIKNIDIKGTIDELEYEVKDGLEAIKELVEDSAKLKKAGKEMDEAMEKFSAEMEDAIEEMKESSISTQE